MNKKYVAWSLFIFFVLLGGVIHYFFLRSGVGFGNVHEAGLENVHWNMPTYFIILSLALWFCPLGAITLLWLFPYMVALVEIGAPLSLLTVISIILAIVFGMNVFRVMNRDEKNIVRLKQPAPTL